MNAHILLAEDDPIVRQTVSSQLQTAGYRVSEAANPPQIMRAIHADPPDLVVLDWTLLNADPGLADGFAFLLLLERNWPKAIFRVVITTRDNSPAFAERAKAVGVAEVVHKSSPPEKLLAAIRRSLGELVLKAA